MRAVLSTKGGTGSVNVPVADGCCVVGATPDVGR